MARPLPPLPLLNVRRRRAPGVANSVFAGAETHHGNSAYWQRSTGLTAENWLTEDPAILRRRAQEQLINNPDAIGVRNAWVDDLIGQSGPTLSILVEREEDERFCERVQGDYADWLEQCDLSTGGDYVDLLALGLGRELPDGDFGYQFVTEPDMPGPVKLGLMPVRASRVETPLGRLGDPNIVLGVRTDANNRPVAYFVRRPQRLTLPEVPQYSEIPAADLLLYFHRDDPEQLRGIPRLAAVLEHFALYRSFEEYTLEAARQQAMLATFITNNGQYVTDSSPDGEEPDLLVADIQGGSIRELGPGQGIAQVNPLHPSQQFGEYMREQHSRTGRALGMPRARVTGDASGHNFSSLRAIRAMYGRALKREQGSIFRRLLVPTFRVWWREYALAMQSGLIPRLRIPRRWKLGCMWEPQEELDDLKAAQAMQIRLELGIDSRSDILEGLGRDTRRQNRRLERDAAFYRAVGIAAPWEKARGAAATPRAASPAAQEQQPKAGAA